MQPQGRAIDKAFKHELGPLTCYSDLLVMYQDRSRGITYQADFQMAELSQMLASAPAVPQQQAPAATRYPELMVDPCSNKLLRVCFTEPLTSGSEV